MDQFHPKQSGHTPEETTRQTPLADASYPVNGETFFQTHFPQQNSVQNGSLEQVSEPLLEDDTKEYIPTSVSPSFYNGFPPQVDPLSAPSYPVGNRELPPEHYNPNHGGQEMYAPLPDPVAGQSREFHPSVDPTYRGAYPSSNVMQGQPPVAGQGNYAIHPHPSSPPPYPATPTHGVPASMPPHSVRDGLPPEETVGFTPNSFHTPPYPSQETTATTATTATTSATSASYGVEQNPVYGTPPYYVEGSPPPTSGDFSPVTTSFEAGLTTADPNALSSQNQPIRNIETPYIQEATPDAVRNLWKRVLEILGTKMSPVCMDTWFYKEKSHEVGSTTVQPVLPVSFQGDTFTLMTSDNFVKEMFEQSFCANVSQVLEDLVNNPIKVVIKLNHSLEVFEEVKQENYNIDFTFENFIESKDNETAYQFAKKIAESETVEFNPFFIYGKSGLGKTHLVCAIANAKKAQMEERQKIQFENTGYVGKKFKISYTTGLEWIQEWIHAIQSKNTRSFQEKYAECDLFILDDVQFLAQRDNTQEELFNLFDNMIRFNRQVVFTSDCHPTKLNGFHARLTSRFAQGLSQEVKFPDLETCIAITRSKAEKKGLNLPDFVIELIAEVPKNSVREIEGIVNKVFAKCDMASVSELDTETIMSLVKDIVIDNKESGPAPKDFIRSVSAYFNVKESDLIAHGRTKQIVRPRNIAIFIIRENTDLSLKEIGELFSGRDHSTIKNSLNNVETMIKKEEKAGSSQTMTDVEDIIQRTQSSLTE